MTYTSALFPKQISTVEEIHRRFPFDNAYIVLHCERSPKATTIAKVHTSTKGSAVNERTFEFKDYCTPDRSLVVFLPGTSNVPKAQTHDRHHELNFRASGVPRERDSKMTLFGVKTLNFMIRDHPAA
ncbi:hypothetical protein Agabi119p4_6884 [Agaricus bisporus var. burnettii]|uniref:Uncharacterized protein n=1 Tax=Agaricus bisporus var. burnettii TaxID=192524 RepID=A0A8H7F0E1_AGABI|nr:hypothetical protein Agabi119p4_6884 [Agaricus bisporus var. burnettii]